MQQVIFRRLLSRAQQRYRRDGLSLGTHVFDASGEIGAGGQRHSDKRCMFAGARTASIRQITMMPTAGPQVRQACDY